MLANFKVTPDKLNTIMNSYIFQELDDKSEGSNSTKEKSKKQKATNLILKLFKTSNSLIQSQSDPYIKATKETKTFRKPSRNEELGNFVISKTDTESLPPSDNDTLIEGKLYKNYRFLASDCGVAYNFIKKVLEGNFSFLLRPHFINQIIQLFILLYFQEKLQSSILRI